MITIEEIPQKILDILESVFPRNIPMTQDEKDLLKMHLKEKGLVADKVTKATQRKARQYDKMENMKKRKEVGKKMAKEAKEKEVKAVDVEKSIFVKAVVEALEAVAVGGVAVDKSMVFVRGKEADFEVRVVTKKERFEDALFKEDGILADE